jgi:hypothetical protein
MPTGQFVVRVAGNVMAPEVAGSRRYAGASLTGGPTHERSGARATRDHERHVVV